MILRRFTLPMAAILVGATLAPATARAQAPWREDFEGPNPSWRACGGDGNQRILQQRRVSGQAHSGQGCEWLQVAGDNGGAFFVGHDVGRPRVIDELLPSVWIRSDRAGLQLAADIILPRVIDPRTGTPLLARVFGTSYNDPGRWQQLRVEGIPRLLERQVEALRAQFGPGVDGREAFVRRVVINAYGGPGITNLWIDDLEVRGFVRAAAVSPGWTSPRPPVRPISNSITPSGPSPAQPGGGYELPPRPGAELRRGVLRVDGLPIFPRVIQYQGEPLPLLKQLGFNAIALAEVPSPEFRAEAARLELWLVCPPPPPAAESAGLGQFGPEFDRVLAWDLGRDLIGAQLAGVKRWAEQVRDADARQRRPLICSPRTDLRNFSRVDSLLILLIDRRPLGTGVELTDYAAWVRRQPLLARLGTPVWTTVQTQPSEGLCRQLAALAPGKPPPGSVAGEQMRLLAYTAISAGSRGLLFLSRSPLSATDPDTRRPAMDLELLNLELQLIEPWTAGGTFVAAVEGRLPDGSLPSSGASGPLPEVGGAVLRTDRARLAIPLWIPRGAQCVAGQSTASKLFLTAPGTPESTIAYEIGLGRLLPLRKTPAVGGERVVLDDFAVSGLVLFAQDPLIVDAVKRRAEACGQRQAELECALAERRFHDVEDVGRQLAWHTPVTVAAPQRISAARRSLQSCSTELAAHQYLAAATFARQTMQPLRLLEQAYWMVAVKELSSPLASPGATSFAALPWHWGLMERLASLRPGPNRLPAGNCEQLDAMMQSGWRHFHHDCRGVSTAVDLSGEVAHSGQRGLRLTARADDPEKPPAMIETPPVWFVSPPVPVEAGQLVRIHGWVNIPAPITGSVDGLMVVDSLGGDDLAERFDRTAGWKEFTLYRAAAQPCAVGVTFVLSGLGEARLDDLTIEVMEPRPRR